MIAGSFASSASAMAHRSSARFSLDRFWSWRLADRAATAWSRVDDIARVTTRAGVLGARAELAGRRRETNLGREKGR
jgi:hypothetical protein